MTTKTKWTFFYFFIFIANYSFGQIRFEDLKIDTTITGFRFATDFQGTKIFAKNGYSDIQKINPSVFSFTVVSNTTAEIAKEQLEAILNMSKRDDYIISNLLKKDTIFSGYQSYYTSYIETNKEKNYKNYVFNSFVIKDGTVILFVSGDLDNGKYIAKFKQTFYSVFPLDLKANDKQLVFVKDGILLKYMENGYADKHFFPNGYENKDKVRQGVCKEFNVIKGFTYISVDSKPEQVFGQFLMYGDGRFVDGKMDGKWKFYVIEDKTFKKILQKESVFTNKGESESLKYFFPSGKVAVESQYKGDKINGEINIYYENGKIHEKGTYNNGLKTGKSTSFYPNGKLKVEQNFVNNIENGLYRSFYSNGSIKETFMVLNEKEDGIYKYYYENGQLWIEKEYKNGLLMNVICSYDDKGNKRDKGTIKNGNGTVNYYTDEGKIYNIQTFEKGVKIKEEDK